MTARARWTAPAIAPSGRSKAVLARTMLSTFLLFLLTGGAEAARADDRARYVTVWRIEPQATVRGPVRVAKGSVVTSARLLPHRLVVLEDDFRSADGKLGAPAGTQMMMMESSIALACSTENVPWSLFGRSLAGQFGKTLCLVDQDRDGRFEGAFQKKSFHEGFLTLAGKVPAVLAAGPPARYRGEDPTRLKTIPTVDLYYRDHFNFGNLYEFYAHASGEERGGCVGNWLHVKDAVADQPFEFLGGLFRIVGMDNDGIDIEMLRPFAGAKFICV